MESSNSKKSYRRLTRKGDPRLGAVVPAELLEALKASAEHNKRQLKDEVIARLNATFEHEDTYMSHDRLMRLIFCKSLAYRGKTSR